ncbi:unnamed protein product [Camellia sinensis]
MKGSGNAQDIARCLPVDWCSCKWGLDCRLGSYFVSLASHRLAAVLALRVSSGIQAWWVGFRLVDLSVCFSSPALTEEMMLQHGPSALELECLGGLGGNAIGLAEPPVSMANIGDGALLLLQVWFLCDSAAGVARSCTVCVYGRRCNRVDAPRCGWA